MLMPFGLKNTVATYQSLVNKMLANQIDKTMAVYVDDIFVKSMRSIDHLTHLAKMFSILRVYKMKLNLNKCTFGVASGKFFGYMVNQNGIEVNPDKIQAFLDITLPKNVKDV